MQPSPDRAVPSVEPPVQEALFDLEVHQGPLPPPADFAAYNHVIPTAADRILKMAEREQKTAHRLRWADWLAQYTALVLGRLFLFALVAAAVYLVLQDKPIEALFAGLAPIAAIIYSTITAKKASPSNHQSNPHD